VVSFVAVAVVVVVVVVVGCECFVNKADIHADHKQSRSLVDLIVVKS